jgi:hypothetical protein
LNQSPLIWPLVDSKNRSIIGAERGGSRDSHLGRGEFELLVERVNPIPAGALESQGL